MAKTTQKLFPLFVLLLFMFGCAQQAVSPGSTDSNQDLETDGSCLLDTDGDGINNCDDNDIDGDGILNDADADDDGDGCYDTDDPNSLNPDIGCRNNPNDEVDEECKTEGEWVTLAEYDDDENQVTDDSINECLTERSFDQTVRIRVKWCADHKDALILQAGILTLKSFGTGLGDVGGFPNLHGDCNTDKARVSIIRDGVDEEVVDWDLPAFAPFRLGIENIDYSQPTRLTNIHKWLGPVAISYANANNNMGPGGQIHVLRVRDVQGGAHSYGVEFLYHFNEIQTGLFE